MILLLGKCQPSQWTKGHASYVLCSVDLRGASVVLSLEVEMKAHAATKYHYAVLLVILLLWFMNYSKTNPAMAT
jgi:hypothetical protein